MKETNELKTLKAMLLMAETLGLSSTYVDPLKKQIKDMIEQETLHCEKIAFNPTYSPNRQ